MRSPRFLPGGGLLYAGIDGHLWILQPGGGTTQVARNAYDGSPAPDGRTLVVTLMRDGIPHVYRIDPDGRTPVRLSHAPARETAVAPDGSYALYVTASDERLWKVPLRGGPPVLLPATRRSTPPSRRTVVSSPRSSTSPSAGASPGLACGSWRPTAGTSGSSTSPGRGGVSLGLPLLPDGTAIDYARTDEGGVGNLWRRHLDGGPEVQVTRFAAEPLTGFDWSPDGRTLACLRGGWHGDAYLVRGNW